jgi:hypothetical protein
VIQGKLENDRENNKNGRDEVVQYAVKFFLIRPESGFGKIVVIKSFVGVPELSHCQYAIVQKDILHVIDQDSEDDYIPRQIKRRGIPQKQNRHMQNQEKVISENPHMQIISLSRISCSA